MTAIDDDVGGRYRLLEQVGAGGMGVVWRGYDERLGRDVAVKRLYRGPGIGDAEADLASHRAMREARITARLHHPHAVAVFDVVEHGGQPCLVMEYFPSSSLADLAAAGHVLTEEEVARIGSEVASALAAAHRVGIVHRDVKPGNVLVAPDGAAKISDFGISHAMGDVSLTSTGMVTGTPAYLAPEVARGEDATPASDVFSLGSTLYAALEGHPPFGTHENPMAMLHRVASGDVDPPVRAGALTGLLVSMLAARTQERPTMGEVAERLGRHAPGDDDPPGGDVPVVPPAHPLDVFGDERPAGPPTGLPARRRPSRALLVLLALAVVAAVVVVLAVRSDGQPDAAPTVSSSDSGPAPSTTSPPSTTAAPSSTAPTTSAPSSPTPSPSPTRSQAAPQGGTPTAGQLREALSGYYALLPGDRDSGWDRLTPRYQRTTARNRDYYESFWSGVDSVRVTDIDASPPGTVTATLTYDYDDGRVFVERTSYQLVRQDGELKIDRSTVVSSVQR
jgi:serine/threonine protein kinase